MLPYSHSCPKAVFKNNSHLNSSFHILPGRPTYSPQEHESYEGSPSQNSKITQLFFFFCKLSAFLYMNSVEDSIVSQCQKVGNACKNHVSSPHCRQTSYSLKTIWMPLPSHTRGPGSEASGPIPLSLGLSTSRNKMEVKIINMWERY